MVRVAAVSVLLLLGATGKISAAPRVNTWTSHEVMPVGLHRRADGVSYAAGDEKVGVQRTSLSNRPLYHPTGCVNIQFDNQTGRALPGIWPAFEQAFDAWEAGARSYACGGVEFYGTIVDNAPEGYDGKSTVHVRENEWCRPAAGIEPEVCHNPNAVAVTRVIYIDEPSSERDGEILEVDIDINAVNFEYSLDGEDGLIDLQSAVTHEVGHALGLDHNCGVEDAIWPRDRDGNDVPDCESVSQDLVNATMYVQVTPGTTSMRTPKVSDASGMCMQIVNACESEISSGCSTSGSPGLIIGLACLWMRRRLTRR